MPMPPNREDYLLNIDDQIASQKRLEGDGGGIGNALPLIATAAGFILARRKIALTRYFSSSAKRLGKGFDRFDKYVLKTKLSQSRFKKIPSVVRGWSEAVLKPFPTAQEQLNMAIASAPKMGLKLDFVKLPSSVKQNLEGWTKWNTFMRGPAAGLVGPNATLGIGKETVGKYGGVFSGGVLHTIGESGEIKASVKNMRLALRSLPGARMEAARRTGDVAAEHKNIRAFVRSVRMPSKSVMLEEERRLAFARYVRGFGAGTSKESSIKELAKQASIIRKSAPKILTPKKFFKSQASGIETSYKQTFKILAKQQLRSKSTHAAYRLYRAQTKLGIGEMYSRHGSGLLQKVERTVRKLGEFGQKHPASGMPFPIDPRVYAKPGMALGGMLGKKPAGAYLSPAGGAAKRIAMIWTEGTAFGMPLEETFGIGVSSRLNRVTSGIAKSFGASEGSWGEYFARYLGKWGRVVGAGIGMYTSYNFVNFLASQATGGWGPTDIVAKMYTSGRETQQTALELTGIRRFAETMEAAFPGTLMSPAAKIAQATAPLWAAAAGKKFGGTKGARTGLAFGIALALLLWGDITQTPEELHEIYTGERDIPIRKGRYWPLGRNPWGGGKIQYWRPHWYPLMKSKYQYKGQLWNSEAEYWGQGSPLSPVLAPILTGKLWDPYYWEKKHYKDRPYPTTGELFEPTMPFAWLGNTTIGEVIKPQRPMHTGYWGVPQGMVQDRDVVAGAGSMLGMGELSSEETFPAISPDETKWKASEAMYTLTEQMGFRGFMAQQLVARLTGRSDLLPNGPIIQSARRATGYERSYWDVEAGDPLATEFLRRFLPHRRRGIDEWNPIQNEMPDWMPGSDYYLDYKHGDPYVKIPMGEARLPGAGYESLNRLHSGVPATYDAVDRFMILADVAPYSNEYKHYRYLAKSMTRDDDYWSGQVQKKISQRSETMKEYEFLELEPSEDVPGFIRPVSTIYRHVSASITNAAALTEATPLAPISKFFPYRTAASTYKDYRLYGSEFTSWGHPIRDFVMPWTNKVRGRFADLFGKEFVPNEESQRREYEEYFDKMKYVKYLQLSGIAKDQGKMSLRNKYKKLSNKTMVGTNLDSTFPIASIPKRERAFFDSFVEAEGSERDEILAMVPDQMQKLYKAQWNMRDKKDGAPQQYNVEDTAARDTVDFFKTHHLPSANWVGWHPDVDIDDVKYKVVKNEGMDIHDFNLWESQGRQLERRPYVPTIEDIHKNNNLSSLQNILHDELVNQGFVGTRINIVRTPSSADNIKLKLNIKRNRKSEYAASMRETIYA